MTSKFVKVKCEKCKNEQMVFERAASVVKCLVCGEVLAEPTGGKVRINVKLAPEKESKAAAQVEEKKRQEDAE